MNAALDLFAASATCFAAFALLGLVIMRHPPSRFDVAAGGVRGQAVLIARAFTISGRGIGITSACIVAVLVFWLMRKPLWIPLFMTLSQIVSQGLVEWCKALYRRTRPDYWLVGLEAGHSYPSGHSVTAVVFFIGWGFVVAAAGLPQAARDAIVGAFAFWGIGIMWSRLALGAHYLTDVAGGALFGCGWLALVCALVLQFLGFVLRAPSHIW